MNREKYLLRIGVDPNYNLPDVDALRLLQYQHLLTVPFENLDIHWKRPIVLETERFYSKIVENGRGGFCYELNGLFNELLRSIGFRTRLISARVFNGEEYGPEFDHAAIIVTIGELEYLVDVGFGDFAAGPLRIVPDIAQEDREGIFVLRRGDFEVLEVAKKNGEALTPQYSFTPFARNLSEFAEMCDFQQYSPDSHFTKGKLCSLMTADGRKTLTDNKFKITAKGSTSEESVGTDAEFAAILQRDFNIQMPSSEQ